MKIIKSFLTKNPCYKANKTIKVKGLMLHSVGCPQPKASVFINLFDNESYNRACVHAFIDGNDGVVYQTLPWNHRGWHGGGSSNNTHIGIEMCEPSCIKYTSGSKFICLDTELSKATVKRTYEVAVELFAMLCIEYNLNPMTDIISHKEGYIKGISSNHSDPEHLWTGLGVGYTMDTFRRAVRDKMNEKSNTPYTVRVNISNLNIRYGAGTNYKKTGKFTGKGIFTIVEESSGEGASKWGKLKSGEGWISLDYTTKI